MVPRSFSYQMIGCSRFQEKILDVRIKARGDCFFCFFFLPPPPSPADQASLVFAPPVFATSLLNYLKAWYRADQMAFPKLENGDNIAKEKKVITHYHWCWLPGKNSYSAQKKLNLRASDYSIGHSNFQLRETRRIEFFV